MTGLTSGNRVAVAICTTPTLLKLLLGVIYVPPSHNACLAAWYQFTLAKHKFCKKKIDNLVKAT